MYRLFSFLILWQRPYAVRNTVCLCEAFFSVKPLIRKLFKCTWGFESFKKLFTCKYFFKSLLWPWSGRFTYTSEFKIFFHLNAVVAARNLPGQCDKFIFSILDPPKNSVVPLSLIFSNEFTVCRYNVRIFFFYKKRPIFRLLVL